MKKSTIPHARAATAPAATHAAPQADQRPATAQQVHLQQAIEASPRQVAQRQQALATAPAPNHTGHSLDDVRVHYNSAQLAAPQAHAYAQGTDIHLAPGQQHLPHEAWHAAQQKQGRGRPTTQLKGIGATDKQ